MKINPTSLSISQLLSVSNQQFIIPAYQRRYSWHKKQILELLIDINNLKASETHFLGSIVVLTEDYSIGLNNLELVDGQQRMVSLFLIIDALKDWYQEISDNREADKLDDMLHCKDPKGGIYSKLVLGDLDKSDFEKVINQDKTDEIINKNLLEAQDVVREFIGSLTNSEKFEFTNKILNEVNIVTLSVSHAKDAFKLFETINNRGLGLSPSDIIKNYLLGHASLLGKDELDEVRKYWTALIVSTDEVDLDDYLRQYLCGILRKKISFTYLVDEFKKYYISNVKQAEILADYKELKYQHTESEILVDNQNKIDMIDFVKDLSKSATLYAKIVTCRYEDIKINEHLTNLRKIKSFPSYIFLLDLLNRDIPRKDKLNVLKMIETIMLRRNIAEYQTGELDRVFALLCGLENDNLLNGVKLRLKEKGFYPDDEIFKAKIITHDFYGQFQARAKYMLEAIEEHITGETLEKKIRDGEDVHLEHIIPQVITTKRSKKEFGDWEDYLGANALQLHDLYVNRIGNLTLFSGELNIKASNNPFASKKTLYKKSNIKITSELCSYRKFAFYQVQSRAKYLADISASIWKF